jgi:hypothetical protein
MHCIAITNSYDTVIVCVYEREIAGECNRLPVLILDYLPASIVHTRTLILT